jgi:cob(I)alamin adenosyltransferase
MTASHGGDSGYADLLGRRRAAKHEPIFEALGTLDEAFSQLGVAKCAAGEERTRRFLHQAQADLFELMAELAMPPDHPKARRIEPAHVEWLDRWLATVQQPFLSLRQFILPGACAASAALDVARAVVRTAERRVALLAHRGDYENPAALAYVNRLSLVLYYLARAEDAAAGVDFDLATAPRERPAP